jgi:predicted RNase H-like HicB family nuclease
VTSRLLVVVEPTANGFGAYAPDLPGCVAVAPSREETEVLMREAVALHLDAMRANGDPPPVFASEPVVFDVAI